LNDHFFREAIILNLETDFSLNHILIYNLYVKVVPLDFNLTEKKKVDLDEAGAAGVRRFIKEFHPEKMQKQEMTEEAKVVHSMV
jgi:hypothetical protein